SRFPPGSGGPCPRRCSRTSCTHAPPRRRKACRPPCRFRPTGRTRPTRAPSDQATQPCTYPSHPLCPIGRVVVPGAMAGDGGRITPAAALTGRGPPTDAKPAPPRRRLAAGSAAGLDLRPEPRVQLVRLRRVDRVGEHALGHVLRRVDRRIVAD